MRLSNLLTGKEKQSFMWISFVVVLSATFLCLNILYFISQAASPLIRDDAWYFLDTVIRKWSLAGVDFFDLFIKRSLDDHAQPANKIVLLLNYKFYDLDFRYEGLIGFLGLLAIISTFVSIYVKSIVDGYANWLSAIAFICAILIITSINTTEIYTWPLVTFGFLPLFLSIATSLITWKLLASESTIGAFAISALLILLIDDTGAIILWISLSVTVAIFLLSGDQSYRSRAIKWGVASTIYVLSYFALLNSKFLIYGTKHITAQVQSQTSWFDPFFYIEALRIVFSSSLVHAQHFIHLGSYALVASWVVSLVVFGFYVRHFVMLFTTKEHHSREKFLATSILIYATVSVVAIIYGRVPVFGIDYLNQPRYVMIYQLIPFALMIDYAYSLTHKKIRLDVGRTSLFFTAALLLFVMQFAFFVQAYDAVSWISRYQDKQAKAIGSYLTDPSRPPGNCTVYSNPICQMPIDKRNELLSLLESERLNLLNPSFQWKYRIFPLDGKSSELKALKVLSWGPNTVNATSNTVGIWINLNRGLIDARTQLIVKIGSHNIDPVVDGNLVTFDVPREISTAAGQYYIELVEEAFSTQVSVGNFEVK